MILIVWIRTFLALYILSATWEGMKHSGILKYFKNTISMIAISLITPLCYDTIVQTRNSLIKVFFQHQLLTLPNFLTTFFVIDEIVIAIV